MTYLIVYIAMALVILIATGALLHSQNKAYTLQTKLIILMDHRPELEQLMDYLYQNQSLANTIHLYDKAVAQKQALYTKQNMLKRNEILPK